MSTIPTTAAFTQAARQLGRDMARYLTAPRTPRTVRVGDRAVAVPRQRGRHAAVTPLPRRVARYGAVPAALASYAARNGFSRPSHPAEARGLLLVSTALLGLVLAPTLAVTAALGGFAL